MCSRTKIKVRDQRTHHHQKSPPHHHLTTNTEKNNTRNNNPQNTNDTLSFSLVGTVRRSPTTCLRCPRGHVRVAQHNGCPRRHTLPLLSESSTTGATAPSLLSTACLCLWCSLNTLGIASRPTAFLKRGLEASSYGCPPTPTRQPTGLKERSNARPSTHLISYDILIRNRKEKKTKKINKIFKPSFPLSPEPFIQFARVVCIPTAQRQHHTVLAGPKGAHTWPT